jgi:hypothetical protein
MVPMLVLLLASAQDPAPVLPPSTGSEVSRTCLAVEQALASGDFDLAKSRAALFPRRAFVLQWNDSAVPAKFKPEYAQMRDAVIGSWARVVGFHPTIGSQGDLAIQFTDHLPPDPKGLPLGSTLTYGTAPRLTVTIALKRGDPLEPSSRADIYNEIGHAIGAYLGLADDPLLGSVMYRDDHSRVRPGVVTFTDIINTTKILMITDQLKKDAEQSRPIKAGAPELSLDPTYIDAPPVLQGTPIPLAFSVTNRGNGPLTYHLVPDCGCFTQVAPGTVAPGETVSLRTTINTIEWEGTEHKGLVLYTNDPTHPTVTIPVAFTSTPASRLYRPEGDTVIVPNGGCTVAVLLTLPKGSHMIPTSYDVSGPVHTAATMEPWSGSAPDPEMNESNEPRQGYRFHITVPGALPVGRTPISLSVQTDDPKFPVLQYSLYLQKGIVALPESVFYGDMRQDAKQVFRLSRHGKPFEVLGVDSGSKFLTAKVKPVSGQVEYEVDLTYNGGAPEGDFMAVVVVRTNDPKQPRMEVQVTGTVR